MRRDTGSGVPMSTMHIGSRRLIVPLATSQDRRTETINVMLKNRSSLKSDSVAHSSYEILILSARIAKKVSIARDRALTAIGQFGSRARQTANLTGQLKAHRTTHP